MRIARIVNGELQIANCIKIKTSVDELSYALFLKAKKNPNLRICRYRL